MSSVEPGSRATRSDPAAEAGAAIRGHLGAAFAASAAMNVLFLASPLYMMQLYGRVLNSGSIETLVSLSIALVLALVAMAAADAARGRLLARAGARVERLLAPAAMRQALARGRGGLTAALGDVDLVRRFLAGNAASTLMDAPFTLLFVVVLYLLHPALGLVATAGVAAIVLTVALARLVETRRERRVEAGQREVARLSTGLDLDRGEVRALGLGPGLAARLAAEGGGIAGVRLSVGELSASVGAAARFARMAAHGAALATGTVLAIEGLLAPAAMLAAAILAGRALGPTETLLTALRQAQGARAALARLAGRLDGLPADRTAGEAPTAGEEAAPRGARLDVSRLVVAEPEGSRAVLRSVGFSVGPGETVVVAGPSGAGKSMLARSLAGAEPAKSGEVRLDRIDIAALDAGALAERVGWLPQDATLFAGSVLDNVTRFGRLSAEEAFAAARTYGLAGLIERLPRGVHTEVGQGGRALPPGARQAVGLWRALAGRRRLVVLDQPSAQMDAEGEVAVLNALRRLKAEGVTAVVISHKPVIATLADRIMVLGDGTIEVFEERATVLDAMRRQSLRPVGERTAEVSA